MPKAGGVIFFADKNFPGTLADFLRRLDCHEFTYLLWEYPDGDPGDDVWIPEVAAKEWIIFGRDRDILTNQAEYEILRKHKARAIFLSGRFDHMTRFDQTVCFFKCWERLCLKSRSMAPGDVLIMQKQGQIVKVDPEKYRARILKQKAASRRRNAGKPQGLGKRGKQLVAKAKAANQQPDQLGGLFA
ncbi:MAG TPA: hypothetical protein VKT78_01075 [Fimbriimonadaceae bacterium]|nr:hypothetical protein [Fimbriimonadaceae bacterium]